MLNILRTEPAAKNQPKERTALQIPEHLLHEYPNEVADFQHALRYFLVEIQQGFGYSFDTEGNLLLGKEEEVMGPSDFDMFHALQGFLREGLHVQTTVPLLPEFDENDTAAIDGKREDVRESVEAAMRGKRRHERVLGMRLAWNTKFNAAFDVQLANYARSAAHFAHTTKQKNSLWQWMMAKEGWNAIRQSLPAYIFFLSRMQEREEDIQNHRRQGGTEGEKDMDHAKVAGVLRLEKHRLEKMWRNEPEKFLMIYGRKPATRREAQ